MPVKRAALKNHNVKSDFCKWPNYTKIFCDFIAHLSFETQLRRKGEMS